MAPSSFRPRKPIPLFAHHGRPVDFVRRYRRDLGKALREGSDELAGLLEQLPAIITQPENLHAAWEHLRAYGGPAPGPDGVLVKDLAEAEVWELMHGLSAVLQDATYRPSEPRLVSVPKVPLGTRPLELANVADRAVSRGVAQVLAPWLEPSFHPRSFGYRPKRGPFHALATALHLADSSRRYTLLTADLQNAFGTVSVQRLLGLVGVRFGDAVRSLVQMLIGHRRRGLSQGAPLSPVLLNLFADHFVDWPWQRDCPGVPLFRYADDVLALCENVSEAQDCERRLRQLLRPAGLQIKHESKAIVDVQRGAASWLGYEIHRQGSAWAIDVRPLAWATLESLLVEAQINPNSVTRCSEVIWGWLDSLGPAYAQPKVKSTAERIAAIAERCGFEEPPSTRKIRERWRRAWRRWKTVLSQTKSDWRHDRLDTESMMNPKF